MPSSQLRANRTENTSYVYRYIRLDKNEPFYIGISYKEDDFKRAYDIHERRRNKIFKDIVKKSPYEIEILFTNLTWEQACEKEKEFIKLYGRKNIKTGTLANMTDGGDGSTGVVLTDEQRKARSIQSKGLKRTEESRRKNSQAKLKYYQENPQAREIISKRMKALPVDYDRLKRMAEKNKKPVLFGAYPWDIDKKQIIWDKVADREPHIVWEYDKNMKLKKENFDMTDAYTCVLGHMHKKGIWK